MKTYNLKFGLYYKYNNWHVCIKATDESGHEEYIADCDSSVFMGYIDEHPSKYIHPIEHSLRAGETETELNINLTYKRLCPQCKSKYNLTQKDINHYLVLAKFGINK